METTALRASELPADWSLADLRRHLGGIPLERIRLHPPPGSATEDDVVEIQEREDRLCELVDGILVEKTVGWYESLIAGLILTKLNRFLEIHDLGKALGADGALQVLVKLVRIPGVSFISWARWRKKKLPRRPIPALVPDLAVEVLSEGNTESEMERKLREYFRAGVRLAWYVDPGTRGARSYTFPDDVIEVPEDGELDGGAVLPGFKLSLRRLFAEADRAGPA
jgi:Uma2 family endonuclease